MYKTAEAITPKHPDKVCDRIADAILDRCLMQDPDTRAAVEVMAGHGVVTITGELTTKAYVNMRDVAKEIVGDKVGVQTNIVMQSREIGRGVDDGGAGDQGIMVGYACKQNSEYLPQELYLARSLCKFIYEKHQQDGKTQVTIDENGLITTIIASFCGVTSRQLEKLTDEWLETKAVPPDGVQKFFNPAGDWELGGIDADTGLTGRKLICDNYGPQIPIGGGAFSGKDATKVDRSGAYMARLIAVELLEKYFAEEVFVKIAYAIGVAEPVMATAHVYKPANTADNKNGELLVIDLKKEKEWDMTPRGIIERLGLKNPIFQKLAEWGSFGNGNIWDNPQKED